MAIKKETYSYLGGLDIDNPPSKRGKNVYSMLRNGRITSSYSSTADNNIGSDGIIRCADGNQIALEFGTIVSISSTVVTYNINGAQATLTYSLGLHQEVQDLESQIGGLGACKIVATYSDGADLYLLTTNTVVDCIWKYNVSTYANPSITLIYINSLGWSVNYNYDIVVNHESASVKRIYIADGVHQVFSINLLGTTNMVKPKKVFSMVPQFNFSQPEIIDHLSGGSHTSGYIQYAYNLYNINGGQTNLSPLSEMQVMSKANGGGEVNEIIGKSNVITISNIDTSYDYVRVYSIKYNDLNVTPTVSVIGDYSIDSTATLRLVDDGRIKYTSSIEQLTFLGGIELVPRCIIGKKNRLILANLQENPWDLNVDLTVDSANFFDSRCYSATSGGIVALLVDASPVTVDQTGRAYTISGVNIPTTHDCIQDYTYLYHPNEVAGTVYGGEGRHLSYKIKETSVANINTAGYDEEEIRSMKRGETYRWAVQFYNSRSQKSKPQWIADVRVPVLYTGMANGTRVTIEFTISPTGHNILAAQDVIGYKFLRVERTSVDKTIVAQGIVSPMIFQDTSARASANDGFTSIPGKYETIAYGNDSAPQNLKVPSPWMRHRLDQVDVANMTANYDSVNRQVKIFGLSNHACISPRRATPTGSHAGGDPDSLFVSEASAWPWTEIYRHHSFGSVDLSGLQISYQENRLLQLYSPDTIFSDPILSGGMKYRVVGSLTQYERKVRGKLVLIGSQDVQFDITSESKANLFDTSKYYRTVEDESYGVLSNFLNANGYIGPNKPYGELDQKTEQLLHTYRSYVFNTPVSAYEGAILSTPELAKNDSIIRQYNGLPRYRYSNSLQSIITDARWEGRDTYVQNHTQGMPILGVDSIASQNITFVDSNEIPYETIMANALGGSIESTDDLLLMEITNPQINQYGGNKYEDRTLNKYIEVGEYNKIEDAAIPYLIIDSGDVFVGDFTFARIARIDGVGFSESKIQLTEIVKFPVETSINIFNRNDMSFAGWSSTFLPTNEEFHKYNNVFSQEGNAIVSIPDPYLFIKNTNFSNRILASKPKIAGETIDSWLDILSNEEMYVEGEYGRINRLLKLNDTVYCFQRDGVSVLSILPRVQIQGSDSVAIELGTGQVLNTYQYINTQSGCDDFNGIISTSSAVYYADKIRRTINIVSGSKVSGLSDNMSVSSYIKGFDASLTYKPEYSLGYDPMTDDVLFGISKGYASTPPTITSEVLMYSENISKFFGIYEFSPKFFCAVDGQLHSIPKSNTSQLYTHFTSGNSCNFYGIQKELELTICLNPEGGIGDCVFNTIEWTHDVLSTTDKNTNYSSDNKGGSFADGIDNITYFVAWNDYLTSTFQDTQLLSNAIRRRFRISRLHIPRDYTYPITRMRGQYLFIKIKYLPATTNKSIFLNDISLYYNSLR